MTAENIAIDICVCTFRRLQLAAILQSLARLNLKPNWSVRVIVADNDDKPSAQALAEQTAETHALSLTYVHAPARNISIARNACLDKATAPYVAFIDDDEIATPGWLEGLLSAIQTTDADVALGPVESIYGASAPEWMKIGAFHATRPVWVRGEIITGYTCNALLRRTKTALQSLRFRNELGRSGGEDTMFFTTLHKAGGKIVYAPDAVVTEIVVSERLQFQWLIKRYFRSGQTHGLILLEKHDGSLPLTRARNIAIGCTKVAFCLAMAVPNLAHKDRAAYWFLRGVMHMGVIARLLGKRELEQYG